MKYCTSLQLKGFEQKISQHWEEGDLPFLLHLSGGNEDFLVDLFDSQIKEGDWILSTHRNHHHALLSGISENKLQDLILRGKSMFVFDGERNFLTSSILAGMCCIGTGIAWALKKEKSNSRVWCFLGDGAEEQGHFYEAVMMTEAHQLPCTFIIEDNNRSVDTSLEERNPSKFRMNWPNCVLRNYYTSIYPHAGNGTKKLIKFKPIKPTDKVK